MQWGVCPHSRNKPICLYKALIRILFSQSPAHAGVPGAVCWACTVCWASVCVPLRQLGLMLNARVVPQSRHVKAVLLFMQFEGWAELSWVRWWYLAHAWTQVAGVFVIVCNTATVFTLEIDGELTESVSSCTVTRHIKLQERNATRPFHKSRMHTQLYGVDSGVLDGKPDLFSSPDRHTLIRASILTCSCPAAWLILCCKLNTPFSVTQLDMICICVAAVIILTRGSRGTPLWFSMWWKMWCLLHTTSY